MSLRRLVDPLLNSLHSLPNSLRALGGVQEDFQPVFRQLREESRVPPMNVRQHRSSIALLANLQRVKKQMKNEKNHDKKMELYDKFLKIAKMGEASRVTGGGVWTEFWGQIAKKEFLRTVGEMMKKNEISLPETKLNGKDAVHLLLKNKSQESLLSSLQNLEKKLWFEVQKKRTKARKSLTFSDADLLGLPADAKKFYSSSYFRRPEKQIYKVATNQVAMDNVVRYCERRNVREKVYEGFMSSFHDDSLDLQVLDLLKLRKQVAESLDFESWAVLECSSLGVRTDRQVEGVMESLWAGAYPYIAPVVRRMEEVASSRSGRASSRVVSSTPTFGPLSAQLDLVDEEYYLAQVRNTVIEYDLAKYFDSSSLPDRVASSLGKLFGLKIENAKEEVNWWSHGWPSDVLKYKVSGSRQEPLGWIYVQLFQSSLLQSANKNFSNTEELSPGHVKINLHLALGSRQKNRSLAPDEVTALCHEMGQAIHFLLTFSEDSRRNIGGWSVDMLKFPSVLTELVCTSPSVLRDLAKHGDSGEDASEGLLRSGRRDAYWYASFIRNLAVYHLLHSSSFDVSSAAPFELREFASEICRKYSPVSIPPSFHFMGTLAGVYLCHSGAGSNSRLGYMFAYMRASSILRRMGPRPLENETVIMGKFGEIFKEEFCDKGFDSHFLKTLNLENPTHPLPPIISEKPERPAPLKRGNILEKNFATSIYEHVEMHGLKNVKGGGAGGAVGAAAKMKGTMRSLNNRM